MANVYGYVIAWQRGSTSGVSAHYLLSSFWLLPTQLAQCQNEIASSLICSCVKTTQYMCRVPILNDNIVGDPWVDIETDAWYTTNLQKEKDVMAIWESIVWCSWQHIHHCIHYQRIFPAHTVKHTTLYQWCSLLTVVNTEWLVDQDDLNTERVELHYRCQPLHSTLGWWLESLDEPEAEWHC